MLHVFVRNLGKTDDWSFLEADSQYVELQEKYKRLCRSLTSPYSIREIGISSMLTNSDSMHPEIEAKMPVMSQQRLFTFLEESHLQIEMTELWARELQPKSQAEKASAAS